jgi:hypothetical protein
MTIELDELDEWGEETRNRISANTRKLAALEKRLDALEAARATAAQPPADPRTVATLTVRAGVPPVGVTVLALMRNSKGAEWWQIGTYYESIDGRSVLAYAELPDPATLDTPAEG